MKLAPAGALLAIALLSSSTLGTQRDGGFGRFKETAHAAVPVPPKLILNQKSFSVEVTGVYSDSQLAGEVQNAVRNAIQNAKRDITYLDANADLRVVISIDRYTVDTAPKKEATVSKIGRIAAGTVWGRPTPTAEVEDKQVTFIAMYRVEDWSTGSSVLRVSDDRVQYQYKTSFATIVSAATSDVELRSRCIDTVRSRIVQNFIPVNRVFPVLLADVDRNLLAAGNAYAVASDWERALATWRSLPAFESPRAEAYRAYSLGLGVEMSAHRKFAADNTKSSASAALTALAEAETYSHKAIELKPDE
jgi:hypothetical protein